MSSTIYTLDECHNIISKVYNKYPYTLGLLKQAFEYIRSMHTEEFYCDISYGHSICKQERKITIVISPTPRYNDLSVKMDSDMTKFYHIVLRLSDIYFSKSFCCYTPINCIDDVEKYCSIVNEYLKYNITTFKISKLLKRILNLKTKLSLQSTDLTTIKDKIKAQIFMLKFGNKGDAYFNR